MPIMRKDVKLGLAVGGVLLAVLVVYVLVVPGNNTSPQTAEVSVDGSDAYANGGDSAGGTAPAAGGASTPKPDDAVTTPLQQGGVTTPEQHATKDAKSTDTSATAGSTAGKTDTDKPTGESASGGWNWDALVAGTEKVPSLGAVTELRTNGAAIPPTVVNGASRIDDTATAGGAMPHAPSNDTTLGGAPQTSAPQKNVLAGAQQQTTGATGATSAAPGNTTTTNDAVAASAKTVVVKDGDTFSKISQAVYGSSKHYAQIERANPNIDPTRLKPGMTINIPALEVTKPAAGATGTGAAAQTAIDPKTEYKVQPNDNLYTISLRLYGKADRVEKIYEFNKSSIGDDSARLKVGMVLKLPEAPSQPTQSPITSTR
jgi:nucleoid-associated protein YgaU